MKAWSCSGGSGIRTLRDIVNGVLRAVGRRTPEEWDAEITETARTADDALATRTSHPTWVLRALRDALRKRGREQELEELLAADNDAPRKSRGTARFRSAPGRARR